MNCCKFRDCLRLWRRRVRVGVLLMALPVAAWALTICERCGYEGQEGARFCSHCGAQLDAVADKAVSSASAETLDPEAEAVGAEALSSVMTLAPVAADMRHARVCLTRQRPLLAEMFARNALALNRFTGAEDREVRSRAILDVLARCKRTAGRVQRTCPACDGTGKGVLQAQTLDGETHRLQSPTARCNRCKGTGRIRGKATIDERKYRLGRETEAYHTLQQSRSRVAVGRVWVPEGVPEQFDITGIVALKRAIPPPCEDCLGLGREDCRTCKGLGTVACDARGCEDGYVEDDARMRSIGSLGLGGGSGGLKPRCGTCKGTGRVQCDRCAGVGSVLCDACNGSGKAERCHKCDGRGLSTCTRCKGTGVYRDKPCVDCRKQGKVECSSCGGTGRKR